MTHVAPPALATGADSTAPRRILVVDDNEDAAETLGLLLDTMGHDVRVTHDGPAALEAVNDFTPDVVFLDIGMPGMNGYEVARRMRAIAELDATVLVAVTGWGQDEDRERSREAGFHLHVVKPVDAAGLRSLLASVGDRERPATA
jgi:CheY-like chemotaxis protein